MVNDEIKIIIVILLIIISVRYIRFWGHEKDTKEMAIFDDDKFEIWRLINGCIDEDIVVIIKQHWFATEIRLLDS